MIIEWLGFIRWINVEHQAKLTYFEQGIEPIRDLSEDLNPVRFEEIWGSKEVKRFSKHFDNYRDCPGKSNGPLAYFWICYVDFFGDIISMGWRKKGVTRWITHWSYIFLALTHRYQVSIGNPEKETGSSIWPKFKHKYPGASHMTNYAKYASANYAELSLHWALRNDLQWNFNWNQYIFIQINAFENVWKMASILSRPQCVKYPMGRLP